MNKVISPLTGSPDVKLIQSLDAKRIINQYQEQLGVDVRRFFTGLTRIQVYECAQSGLQFYFPETLAGDAAFYAELSRKYKGYYTPWKWEHSVVFPHIRPAMRVLEIGCGYGYFLKKLMEAECDVTGLELNQEAVEYGAVHSLPIKNEDLAVHARLRPEGYDMVCAFQVYEHVTQLRDRLEQAVACLNPGGLLALGVPNNDAYLFRHDPYHTLNLPPHHTLLWSPRSLAYLPSLFPLDEVAIRIEPAIKKHKSAAYRAFLRKKLGPLAGLAHTLTRPVVKNLPVFQDGATVVAMFRKR